MHLNTFDYFAQMVRRGDKAIRLAPMSNIHAMDIKGNNGFVTFGVPIEIVHDLMDTKRKFAGGFLMVDDEVLQEYVKTEKFFGTQ
jgi:hypothetical protein